ALYTYEDGSNDLKLAASGGGGLLELSSHFEIQKVMYGFCSVRDPQAVLPKYVLVNWVGEDVPDARKCACASHVAKIAEFFQVSDPGEGDNAAETPTPVPDGRLPPLQGVDVIVNASSVEDIDPGAIGQRLSNGLARVSSPVLHRLRLREDENAEPVGTTYQKTDATVEMKRLNREQFWEQAKKEEELRKEEERKKALDARLRFEQERMEQERLEQEERERRYREREEQIEEHRHDGAGGAHQQSMEAEEARQRLKEQSIFGEQQEEDNRQQLRKSESEVEEAAAIIAQRPDNPRDFFKQQERVASGSSDAISPGSHRTAGRLHCPFIKTADSGPPSSSSSSSSPPRTPFPYITCHRTPNLSSFFPCSQSDAYRKASAAGCSPCESSPAATPLGEPGTRALGDETPATPKDSPSPSTQEAGPATPEQHWPFPGPEDKAAEPPGKEPSPRPVWTVGGDALGDLVTLEPTEPSPPPAVTEPQPGGTPNPESLIDLWQSDEATPAAAWPLPAAPVPEGPPATLPDEGTLLSLDELPEPPATFCDAEQEEEEAAGGGDPQPRGLGCQRAPQEDALGRETPPITNGEMVPKDGTPGRGEQTSEGYFSQSQEEEVPPPEEPSAKAPQPVFYNKP
ncbi:DREB protein, partial [Podargus strigoides]|nr:DREB protein [Podargus strigoides]